MSAHVPEGAFRHMAQIANAQKSTGPTTDLGKAAAARNALLHGLTSNCETLDGEPEHRSRNLLRELITDIRPADTREWEITKTIHHSMIGAIRCREHAEAARTRRQNEIIEVEELSKQFDERPKYVMNRLLQHDAGISFLANRVIRICHHTSGVLDSDHMRLLLNLKGVRACDALDDRDGYHVARICYQHGLMLNLTDATPEETRHDIFEYFESLRGERSEIVFQARVALLSSDETQASKYTTELEELMQSLIDLVTQARVRLEENKAEIADEDAILAMQDLTKDGALTHRYEKVFERSCRNAWRYMRQHRGIKPNEAFIEVQVQFAPALDPEAMAPWEPEQWEGPDDSEAAPEAEAEPEAAPDPAPTEPRNEARYVRNESAVSTITPMQPTATPTIEPPPRESR